MFMTNSKRQTDTKRGFTLLESMISVLLITIVVGAIFRQLQKAQAGYRVVGQKLDMTQQQRDFIDQFTRDLHQAGYPAPLASGLGNPVALSNTQVAAGITLISPTVLTMEGDIDNSGAVRVVTYSFINPGACPCSIQRTIAPKTGGPATTYTAVENLIDPGAQGIFTAYGANGSNLGLIPALALPVGATSADVSYQNMKKIRSVRITFTLQGTSREMNGTTPSQVTMTGMARIPND
jgi:prepilin-type N-terminal cleavage/methylation domain-containing protein